MTVQPTYGKPRPTERLTYRINEVMIALGVSKTKVLDMIREGELPVVRLGRCTLIRRTDLEALLDRASTARLDEAPSYALRRDAAA